MQNWIVIYPRGDRTMLDVALVWDYEEDDWDLASLKRFSYYEDDAREYMKELAAKHNLSIKGERRLLD